MKIASVLNVHTNPELVKDTIDAQRAWLTDRTLLVVDGASWDKFKSFEHRDVVVVRGVNHAARKSPYKNMGIGLLDAYRRWPDSDWFCYSEYDTLFVSDKIKEDLDKASKTTASFLGFNPRHKLGSQDHWLVQNLLSRRYGQPMCWKSIGCLMFYSGFCIQHFVESDFISRMLDKTSAYQGEHFPHFTDYAVEEILFPSAASLFGDIKSITSFESPKSRYVIKFGHDVDFSDVSDATSVIHPAKNPRSQVRRHFRRARKPFLE